jgi:HAD superfamily hydrolase (TIGR01509 family)
LFERQGLRQALVSNSDRIVVNANIRVLGLEEPGFISVSINDVVRGKPDPEPYERAATLLGVAMHHCRVIEDSPTGAQAGLAAGAQTIAWPEDQTLEFPSGIRPVEELEPTVRELLRYTS